MSQTLRTLTIATASLLLGPAAVFAQAGKPAPVQKTSAWIQGRTPDGQPDMQGTWTNASNVPLERPKELGTKEVFTEQEKTEYEQHAARGFIGDRAKLPAAHYDQAQFGLDPSQAKFPRNLRTSMIIGPEGRIPPLTPAAEKRLAEKAAKYKGHEFDGPENRPLGERCIMWPQEGPPMLPVVYNNNLEIVQGPGYVAILQEMIHDVRVIPLDGRPHISPDIRLWRGDSRGHWEGNTLVVDTTNYTSKTAFRGSTESLRVTERFTRTGPDAILYEFTVEDPATWAKPWTAQLIMTTASGQIYEYACQEANTPIANNLRGARFTEKAAAEAGAESK